MSKLNLLPILGILVACANSPQPVSTGSNDIQSDNGVPLVDKMRNPFPVDQANPVVPPPKSAEPEVEAEPPKPKINCEPRCSAFAEINEECASRTQSCQRIIAKTNSDDNDTCRDRNKACKEADIMQSKLGPCTCS